MVIFPGLLFIFETDSWIFCAKTLYNFYFEMYFDFSFQVVAEYERAVIFRLGRLRKGGSKGPGIFTVIPCIDTYRCVDLRTVSFDVPPQEVIFELFEFLNNIALEEGENHLRGHWRANITFHQCWCFSLNY